MCVGTLYPDHSQYVPFSLFSICIINIYFVFDSYDKKKQKKTKILNFLDPKGKRDDEKIVDFFRISYLLVVGIQIAK